MSEGGAAAGVRRYVSWLVSAAVFPFAWMRAMRIAKAHEEADPRAVKKAGGAIVIGVLLLAGGVFATTSFHADNVAGVYDSLDNRLSIALGNEDYKAAVTAEDMDEVQRLEPNHELYLAVSERVAARDDARAKALIEDRPDDVQFANLDRNAQRAFEIKDEAVAGLRSIMVFLVYPSLAGVFYAPLVFALGSTLKAAWEPSGTVGFKAYPGGAAGTFLLLGGFGIPSLPFAAWVLKDLRDRTDEGQISL